MPKINDVNVEEILDEDLLKSWSEIREKILSNYDVEEVWHTANRGKDVELKFSKKGKTLVSLFPNYPEKNKIGIMIIFGKNERKKFENNSEVFSEEIVNIYNKAKTFHDGKWVMFLAPSENLKDDLLKMLKLKIKPNKIS